MPPWHMSSRPPRVSLLLAAGLCLAVVGASAQAPAPSAPRTSQEAEPGSPPSAPADEWHYTVRPGDTLWTFSRDYLSTTGDWRRLQALNGIRDPQRLTAGTRLRVPFTWMKAQPVPARVVEVAGRVEVSRAGLPGTARLVAGMEVGPGDSVTTGDDGSATIELADGSRVLLGPGGRMVLDVLSAFERTGMVDSRFRLERGRAQTRVTPRRGRFRIWTPAAATVVRGTDYRAEFDAASRVARTEVTTGTVETSAGDASVTVVASFGTAVREGEAPSAPVPLLPAPVLAPEAPLVRRVPVRLAVPPVSGAVAYYLEVAPDDRFLTLAFVGQSPTGAFTIPNLPDGRYAFRTRAIDAQGLQGLDAVSSLTLDARPEAPALMAPAVDAVVAASRPTFTWSRPEGATGYRFQLASDVARDTPIVDTSLEAGGPFTLTTSLAPGRYAWRVATRAAGEEGPFGDWHAFTHRPLPPGPSSATSQREGSTLRFAWAAGSDGSRYQYQFARDAAFTDVILDQTTTTPEATLARPAAGTYYLRVKAIEADGYEGEFGPAQAFDIEAPPRPKKRFPWRVLAPVVPVVLIVILL